MTNEEKLARFDEVVEENEALRRVLGRIVSDDTLFAMAILKGRIQPERIP